MKKILAIYGSPRRQGNTTLLLNHAVQGVLDTGAQEYLQEAYEAGKEFALALRAEC